MGYEKMFLVPVTYRAREYREVLKRLWVEHNARLADINYVGSIPVHIIAEMKTLPEKARVILFNRRVPHSTYSTLMAQYLTFPFCSVHRNNYGITVLQIVEAIKPSNFFLCVERQDERRKKQYYRRTTEERSPLSCALNGGEYQHHVDIEETKQWRTTRPAYVNMDRSSDNIGMSSWDGNLVSWNRARFQSRVLYGQHSGFYSE